MAVLALIAAALSGCTREPPEILAEDSLAEILVELHLLDARAELFSDVPPAMRDSIFRHHGTDSLTVARSVRYYAEDPNRYADLYERVMNQVMEDELRLHEYQ